MQGNHRSSCQANQRRNPCSEPCHCCRSSCLLPFPRISPRLARRLFRPIPIMDVRTWVSVMWLLVYVLDRSAIGPVVTSTDDVAFFVAFASRRIRVSRHGEV